MDEKKIIEQYYELRSCRAVAEVNKCSAESVRRILIKNGISRTGWKVPERIGPPKRNYRYCPLTAEEKSEIISVYRRLNNQKLVAVETCHSMRTVNNVLKECGLAKGMGGNQDKQIKITDDELREEAKTLNCKEIALKYDMSEERVYRRARKLGIDIPTKYEGGKWYKRASRYGCKDFDKTITLRALIARDNGVCQICGKQTDDSDITNGHIGRMYPTLDHIIPLSKGGSHTWDNVQLAHMHCNAGKCNRMA